jgi:hypothetical protein
MRCLATCLLLVLPVSAVAATPDLTLKRVMLSSGGVGYFEYEAEVDGPGTLGLDVPLGEVDDVLKSLVVFDSEGGVGGIELPGRDGSHSAFGDIPLDAASLASPLAYLNGLKGIEITVTGPKSMTGRIMGAETVTIAPPTRAGANPVQLQRTRVTVMTGDGLQQFILEDAESVQVTDRKLRDGIGKALEEEKGAASQDKRHFTLHIEGGKRRLVRVGYVVAAPLWKATYRPVLPKADEDKGTLQGWAVLENESGVDWNGVELTLQSGNPVTFRQALYQSYFVDRPEVPVEVFDRILPPVDTRATGMVQQQATLDAPSNLAPPPPAAPAPMMPMAAGASRSKSNEIMVTAEQSDATPLALNPEADSSEAQAATLFRLPKPVVLAAGHTASVPILDRKVPASSIDLARQGDPHPLAAARLVNESGASLPPGVLALYAPEGQGFFAGDARLGALPDHESRLLSFAEDLRAVVQWGDAVTKTFKSLAAANGVLQVETKSRTAQVITLVGPAEGPQKVLVEIGKPSDSHLTVEGGTPTGTEETAEAWRLPIDLKAGETKKLSVSVERIQHREIKLQPSAARQILVYADAEGLSAEARAAIESLAALDRTASAQEAQRNRLQNSVSTVEADETRLRENIKALASGDTVRARLLRQMEADEDKIGTLRHDMDAAGTAAEKARQDLADAIGKLKF